MSIQNKEELTGKVVTVEHIKGTLTRTKYERWVGIIKDIFDVFDNESQAWHIFADLKVIDVPRNVTLTLNDVAVLRHFDIKISPYACVANNEIETSIIVDVRSLTL